jgi:hypothetical protein
MVTYNHLGELATPVSATYPYYICHPHLFHPCVVVSREDIIRGLCDAHGGDVLLTPIKQILGPFLPGCCGALSYSYADHTSVLLCRSGTMPFASGRTGRGCEGNLTSSPGPE